MAFAKIYASAKGTIPPVMAAANFIEINRLILSIDYVFKPESYN